MESKHAHQTRLTIAANRVVVSATECQQAKARVELLARAERLLAMLDGAYNRNEPDNMQDIAERVAGLMLRIAVWQHTDKVVKHGSD